MLLPFRQLTPPPSSSAVCDHHLSTFHTVHSKSNTNQTNSADFLKVCKGSTFCSLIDSVHLSCLPSIVLVPSSTFPWSQRGERPLGCAFLTKQWWGREPVCLGEAEIKNWSKSPSILQKQPDVWYLSITSLYWLYLKYLVALWLIMVFSGLAGFEITRITSIWYK